MAPVIIWPELVVHKMPARALSSDEGFRIHRQSQSILFNEWLAQLTLCLAPLAAHVLVGVPTIVNRTVSKIPWHRRIPLLNPITIFWRYMIIADRWLRCRNWAPKTMAVSNAAFFIHDKGKTRWDSSEDKMQNHVDCLVQPPSGKRIALLSVSMLGTLITVFQGIQALHEVILIAKIGFSLTQGIAIVFFPLAIGSLLRLASALWLTQDFAFRDEKDGANNCEEPVPVQQPTIYEGNMRSQRYLPSVLLRVAVVLLIMSFFILQIFHIVFGTTFGRGKSASGLVVHLLYHILTFTSLVLFITYLSRGKGRDVLIPCINSTWYTIYTVLWYAFALLAIVINALEMRRTSCGVVTTYPPSSGQDEQLCAFYA